MDVNIDPQYQENGWIYLSYSHQVEAAQDDQRPPAMTRLVRGKIRDMSWVDEQVIYEAPHDTYRTTRHHYGNRIVFDKKGYLYFSIGDRGAQDQAQDSQRPNGKIHRIFPDGSIPERLDNTPSPPASPPCACTKPTPPFSCGANPAITYSSLLMSRAKSCCTILRDKLSTIVPPLRRTSLSMMSCSCGDKLWYSNAMF